ncbi:MAG: GNAT family N-acetyltransferase [Algicola sp.]|nr:GNAT family N-acetyltransferase [Algicola sp.]
MIEISAKLLQKAFRGKDIGLSNKLLQTAMTYCSAAQISTVYLGTMQQFKAAQSFYIKHGFQQILEHQLPSDFMLNSLDSVFLKKHIAVA